MNRIPLLIALCVLAIAPPALADGPAAPPTAAPLTGAVAEAAQVVDGFKAAMAAGDADAALAFLADDALVYEVGHVEHSKGQFASDHLLADIEFSKAVNGVVTRRAGHASGDLAWVASEGRTTGRFKDRDIDRITTETMVLRRDPQGWRIVHVHWSSRAPTP